MPGPSKPPRTRKKRWRAGIWEVGFSQAFREFYVDRKAAREVWSVALDHDAELLAAATFDGVTIWETKTGKPIAHLAPGVRTWKVLFTPEKGPLIVTSQRGLEMWSRGHTPTGRIEFQHPQQLVKTTGGGPHVAALSGDGRFLASMVSSQQAVLLDLRNNTTRQLDGKPAADRVAVSQHGHWVAAGLPQEDCLRIWDGRTGNFVRDLSADWPAATFSPNDKWLVISSPEDYQFWNLQTWRPRPAIANMQLTCAPLAFSPDGSLLAIAKQRWLIDLIEPSSGREQAVLPSPASSDALGGFAFSGDGRMLAALAKGRRHVKVWNLAFIRKQLAQRGLDW
jgi:WD40 repeat protein